MTNERNIELMKKWNDGTITDDEIIEVASKVIYVPESAKTSAFAKRFKKLIDDARYNSNKNSNDYLHIGDGKLQYFRDGKTRNALGSNMIFIGSSKYEFEFDSGHKGFIIKANTYLDEDGVRMPVRKVTETIDENGFVSYIEEDIVSDYHKTHMPLLRNGGSYNHMEVFKLEPGRVRKTIQKIKDGQIEKIIQWETVSAGEKGEFGSLSLRDLPTLNEAAMVEIHSEEYLHTNPGMMNDILVNPNDFAEEDIISFINEMEDEDKKQIVIDILKDKYPDLESKVMGRHKQV